ncbi:MAG TPA: deoxyguanosinetriphosphate triphosphohydrolase [Pseudolabrys sp.]|nr:deoxyguanosinetriphosphate triphosphohydrolase [Pseudolabrys sp.]
MAIETGRKRAVFAADPAQSRGRRFAEPASATRNAFRRDCDRIIHSTAFRRLAHKTQVFVYHEGDHYRTRLTHTLEVAQIARSLARALGCDEDLAEGLALAHDLGHPPFGHAGERALDEALARFGGFDHNAQALRIVTELERRYAAFDGLNLTWETLEGLVKHNGPLTDREGRPVARYRERGVPAPILAYAKIQDLELWSQPSVEAQIAALSDDIAYDAHDIDDGLRAELFTLDDIAAVPLVGDIVAEIDRQWPALEAARRGHETMRRLITRMIEDVIAETERRVAVHKPSAGEVRKAKGPLVEFSPPMKKADTAIKGFLYPRMYRHDRVMRVMHEAENVVRDLFAHYVATPADLPMEWSDGFALAGESTRTRRIGDYIAGMTDRYALVEHAKYFKTTPELR